MYQLPVRFIKLGQSLAICATRVVAIISTESYQARRIINEQKKAGTLINGCGNKAALTAVMLDNGSVASSPYSVNKILSQIEQSNCKQVGKRIPNQTRRLKVYDVADEQPDEQIQKLIQDINNSEQQEDLANEDD